LGISPPYIVNIRQIDTIGAIVITLSESGCHRGQRNQTLETLEERYYTSGVMPTTAALLAWLPIESMQRNDEFGRRGGITSL
jgi:hypothetical protein